jgi:hypothetical protein
MPLLAAFNGEMPEPGKGAVCKTAALGAYRVGSSNLPLSAKLFERTLTRFELVLALLIPVRRFAGWADSRLANSALARFPFMGAAVTFISFSFECDHAHAANILDNNILSRCTFLLTTIYRVSNILFRWTL